MVVDFDSVTEFEGELLVVELLLVVLLELLLLLMLLSAVVGEFVVEL